MIYADYNFYVSSFYGNVISEEEYAAAALRASQFLDYYTMNRAKDHCAMPELKMACCALAEEYHTILTAKRHESQTADGEMQSQTVGSYSVTYRSRGESLAEASAQAQSRLAQVARQYLAHTGLLYRGGGCGCIHRTL